MFESLRPHRPAQELPLQDPDSSLRLGTAALQTRELLLPHPLAQRLGIPRTHSVVRARFPQSLAVRQAEEATVRRHRLHAMAGGLPNSDQTGEEGLTVGRSRFAENLVID